MSEVRPIDANSLEQELEECRNKIAVLFGQNSRQHGLAELTIATIKARPTLDYAPVVRAYWIIDENNNATCSNCGEFAPNDSENPWYPGFCGECGAKMDADKGK